MIVNHEPAVTVDRDTEHLIQQVMNENFKHCTVIFLATRFRVIVQMDRVMVMKHGELVEFDTPLNLLDNPKSKFSLMLSQTGDVDPNYLRRLAMKKAGITEQGLSQTSLGSVGSTRSSLSRNSAIPKRLGELFIQPSQSSSLQAEVNPAQDSSSEASIVVIKKDTTEL